MTAPLTLDFVLDEDYLVARVLDPRLRGVDFAVDNLQEKAGRISPVSAEYLAKHAEKIQFSTPYLDLSHTFQQMVPITEETWDLLAVLKGTPEYEQILRETRAYKARVEQQWLRNLDASLPFMRELTGLPLDGRYAVFVLPPYRNYGRYLGGRRVELAWSSAFANEDTLTLWHEILHDADNLDIDSIVGHSIIELAADNELRVKLNGGNHIPLHGCRARLDLRRKIFNADWPRYLSSPKNRRDIREFKEEMQWKYIRADRT